VNYDLIGDIHGHAAALERLFARLGYAQRDGRWDPPADTTPVFLGDFIDRGPENRRVLEMVRPLIESGRAQAVMGNHEYNALAYWTEDGGGGYLRGHSGKNRGQHDAFIKEFSNDPAARQDVLDFFLSLPLVLELPDAGLRVVHACWSERKVAELREHELITEDRMTREFLVRSVVKGSREHAIVEVLLKGPEVALAGGRGFRDKDRNSRQEARYRWWGDGAPHDASRVGVPVGLGLDAPPSELAKVEHLAARRDLPVVFGHYWWDQDAHGSPVGADWACVDLSVAKGGHLACYRWQEVDRGAPLAPDRLVCVR